MDLNILLENSINSDHAVWICRLNWVSAGQICHKVNFYLEGLILMLSMLSANSADNWYFFIYFFFFYFSKKIRSNTSCKLSLYFKMSSAEISTQHTKCKNINSKRNTKTWETSCRNVHDINDIILDNGEPFQCELMQCCIFFVFFAIFIKHFCLETILNG